MATRYYHLESHWRLQGTIEEVADLLRDTDAMRRWWRSFILDAQEVEPGDDRGRGKVVSLHVNGWLPYRLHWQYRVTESRPPEGFTIRARGDLNGVGVWTLRQDGEWADVNYDWKITADRWFLRYFSFLLKPLFASNHRWAMARGEEGLRLELARRRAATEEERARIPLPPDPARTPVVPLLVGACAVTLLFFGARRLAGR